MTKIGPLGGSSCNGLTVAPDGTLYAGSLDGNLYVVNPGTGKGTLVGPFGEGLQSSGDIVWGPLSVIYVSSPGGDSDLLLTVNPGTGQGTVTGDLGYYAVYGLSFTDGKLYGLASGGQLLLIDIVTGAGIEVKDFDILWWGAS